MSNFIINPYMVLPSTTEYCNGITLDRNYWVANTSRNVLATKILEDHPAIGNTVTSVSMWLTGKNASSTDTFTFGIWNSGGTKVATSASINVKDIADNGDPSTVKYTYDVTERVLAVNDYIGIEQTSTNYDMEFGADEGGSPAYEQSWNRDSASSWSLFDLGNVGFGYCISG